jgi:sporulation protein YlmC with PRC-barrel domain
MTVRLDLDAKVHTRDGEDAGTVQRAIFDPVANRVQDFVVDTGGLLGRPILVPASEIETSEQEGHVLRLSLSKTELERLPTYVPEHYMPPPAGWVPPLGFAMPDTAYLWPGALITPPPEPIAAEEAVDDEVGLSHGDAVMDKDGHDLGVVDELRLDPKSGSVQGFTLRVGGLLRTLFGGGEHVEVSRSHIDRVGEGIVHLRLTKEEVKGLTRGTETAV